MSREDANLLIALASLGVAVVATWGAVHAIRRDRADLRVTVEDAGAGSRWVTIVNVGLRPVRIERLVVRRSRLAGRFSLVLPIHAAVVTEAGDHSLPVAIEPAASVVLHYFGQEHSDVAGSENSQLLVEDAAGRRFAISRAVSVQRGPEERAWSSWPEPSPGQEQLDWEAPDNADHGRPAGSGVRSAPPGQSGSGSAALVEPGPDTNDISPT